MRHKLSGLSVVAGVAILPAAGLHGGSNDDGRIVPAGTLNRPVPADLDSLIDHVDAFDVGRAVGVRSVEAMLLGPHHAEPPPVRFKPGLLAQAPPPAPQGGFHAGRILVRFKPGATQHARQSAHGAFRGARVLHTYRRQTGLELIQVPDGKVRDALAAYRRDPNVEYTEPDHVITISRTPNDPDFGELWGLHNEGQTVSGDPGTAGADIGAVEAWDIWTGDPTFRVAVIDTGVDYTHPDLVDNIWTNPGEIPDNYLDDDGNGYIDDVHGFNFLTFSGDSMDDHGHGTHVAGTIGAVSDNGIGVAGVNWRCQIVGLKFLNANGSGTTSGAVQAIEYAIANGIRLSNNSWGGTGYSQSLYNAIQDARDVGHVFVAAAGNSGVDADLHPHYPSAYDLGNIISVAATDNDDNLASFSNYGTVSVDLGAPGVKIYSTIAGGGYTYMNGTSMASPHVTGVLGLLMSRLPTLGWPEVRDVAIGTTRPIAALQGKTVSGGVIDAAAAVGDCNRNGVPDDQDIAGGTSGDCGANGVPDECEGDCNNNGRADSCDLFLGSSFDCTGNGVLDDCEPDCNNNGRADSCELADSSEDDCNRNGVPDSCEPDCNANGVADACDIWFGTSADCTGNGMPDECEPDCNNNTRADSCDIDAGSSTDCNGNDVPDECDLAAGTSDDCSSNGVPDECEYDCDGNGRADSCDIADGLLPDTDGDGVADMCELGMRLVPVEASGPHTIEANQIFLPVGGQRVTLELRMSGWDTDSDYTPQLRLYQAAVDATTFSNGLNGSLTYAQIACTSNDDCRRAAFNPRDACIDGFCDEASAVFVDMSHPDFVYRDNGAIGGTFLNMGLPPLVGGIIMDGSAAPPDTGQQQYGATVLLDVPEDAEGTFVVSLYPDQTESSYTFWAQDGGTMIPIPAFAPVIITLPADCNLNGVEDAQDIANGTSDDCNENGVPDECIARESDCNANLHPDECDIADGTSFDVNGNSVPDECEPSILYVDAAAAGESNGRTWQNAFTDLQDALDVAAPSAGAVDEIWVAVGTYRPSKLFSLDEPRSYSFVLVSGVAIYGGFAGGESERAQRDPDANVTILSGDIAGNDGPNFMNNGENAYQVVRGDGVDAGARLDGFTITGGNADGGYHGVLRLGWGGGMYVADGSPTVSNCVFSDNTADYGGGLAVGDGGPSFDHCLITKNNATVAGGAHLQGSANPSFTHCRFVGNTSWVYGGLLIDRVSEMTLANCLVIGNVADSIGGIACANAAVKVINCTIAFNRATDWVLGAGMQHSSMSGGLHLSNSILWGNEGNGDTRERFQLLVGPSAVLLNNCIQGWDEDYYQGVGNFGDDPVFVNPLGPDGLAGTADDDLRLLPGSPAVNTGDNANVPESLTRDLDGNPRIVNVVVDLGVYEQIDCNGNGVPDWDDVGGGGSVDCDGNGVPDECEPDCNVNGVTDACDIEGGQSIDCDQNGIPDECEPDCNLNGVTDACDIAGETSQDCNANLVPDECDVTDGSSGDCDNDDVPDECVLADIDCNENGQRDACDIFLGTSGDCDANGVPDDCEDCNGNARADSCDLDDGTSTDDNDNGVLDECDYIVYVDSAAGGAGDGTNWADAFTDLADALALAADPLITVSEVWVADGDYTPDRGTGAAALSFELSDGIRLFGGFAGGEARFSDRDPVENPAVLTGDLAGDDAQGSLDREAFEACESGQGVPHPPGCQEFDLDDDGDVDIWDEVLALRIIDNSWHVVHVPSDASGCVLDGFTVRGGNALISDPWEGGGLLNEGGVTIRSCILEGNWAYSGGGVASYQTATNLRATDCVFRENYADFGGAGLSSFIGVTEIRACTFDSNEALRGAGAQIAQTTLVSDSVFVDNQAEQVGGALFMSASPVIVNTVFDGNSSGYRGGAVFNKQSSAAFTNCVFRANTAFYGGAVWNEDSDSVYVNCVFTGNIGYSNGGALRIFHNSNPSLINCTLSYNFAVHGGGVAYADSVGGEDGVTITNSILWANTGSGDDESGQILLSSGVVDVNYSCVEGWTGSLGGVGNTGDDPLLVDFDGPDEAIGTEDDDLRLGDDSPCIDAGDNLAVPVDTLDADSDGNTTEPMPLDADGTSRFVDDLFIIDTGRGAAPVVDMGAYEYGDDCNGNGIPDDVDIATGTSTDCSGNGAPDECEPDCNGNGRADSCDILDTTSADCNENAVPDMCDIRDNHSGDCDGGGTPDECELDSDGDGTIDACEECVSDPDKTEPGVCGCGVPDDDSDGDTVADCVDLCPGFDDLPDADEDGVPDACDQCEGFSDGSDADGDDVPDGCDICSGFDDAYDADEDGVPDGCDQCSGFDDTADCNTNTVPDGCDIQTGTSIDSDGNGIPDECEPPLLAAEGCRHVSITPFAVPDPVALLITSPDYPCLSHYLTAAGRLGDEPVFLPPSEWGTVTLTEWIAAESTYTVQNDNGFVLSSASSVTTPRWGDTVGNFVDGAWAPPDGTVAILDAVACLDRFSGLATAPMVPCCDLHPAIPDGTINITDIVLILEAFTGSGYPWEEPCE